jgi:hypothetical protein
MPQRNEGERCRAGVPAPLTLLLAIALVLLGACGGDGTTGDGAPATERLTPSVPAPTGTSALAQGPYVFTEDDTDLYFHLDTFSFRVDFTIECQGGRTSNVEWLKVARQGSGLDVCQIVVASATGSHVCNTGPGDFQLVRLPDPGDQSCTRSWGWRVTITPR